MLSLPRTTSQIVVQQIGSTLNLQNFLRHLIVGWLLNNILKISQNPFGGKWKKIGFDDFQLSPQDTQFQQHHKLRQSHLYHCIQHLPPGGFIRILKIRRRRRQREGQKSNSFNNENNSFPHHAFLYFSLPSVHDYAVKMPNFTFYGGSTQARMKFSLFLKLDMVHRNSTLGGFNDIWQSYWLGVIAMKIERTRIHFFWDGFAAVANLGS